MHYLHQHMSVTNLESRPWYIQREIGCYRFEHAIRFRRDAIAAIRLNRLGSIQPQR
jgi:hypothetical protein